MITSGEDLFAGVLRSPLGLAPHYPFLWSAVVGLEAKNTLEIGAGGSTRVILDALAHSHGRHVSISTDAQRDVELKTGAVPSTAWTHVQGLTDNVLVPTLLDHRGPYDLVLHDGSHAADVVCRDLLTIFPCMKQYGLVLVHDTQHSYVGEEMREGLRRALRYSDIQLEQCTLPYGFGLTIIRVLGNEHNGSVSITRQKTGSPHRTVPCTLLGERG